MAFALTGKSPIPDQLHRIVEGELRRACEELTPDKILEARKRVKKARAVLRLLRDPLGSHYAVEMKRLRAAAHELASLRDVDATVATIRSIHGRFPTVVTEAVTREVARGLESRRRRARAHAAPKLGRARRTLEAAKRSVPKRVERAGDLAAIRAGTVAAYRRARADSRKLTLDAGAGSFHRWRKRVKAVWYDVRLFSGLHRAPRGRAATLKRLERLLGDDHDLAVLRDVLLDSPDRYGSARVITLTLGAITKRQAALRARALALGQRAFSETPKEFRGVVKSWWRG